MYGERMPLKKHEIKKNYNPKYRQFNGKFNRRK